MGKLLTGLKISLILTLLNLNPCQASILNKANVWINFYNNSKIQPIIYGYYFIDDWRIFIGVKIKI